MRRRTIPRFRIRLHPDPNPNPDFRFVSCEPNTGCWIWLGTHSATRPGQPYYGYVLFAGRYYSAHRLAFENAFGPIPEGLIVHHRCENTLCVNPHHLEALTQGDHGRFHNRQHREKYRAIFKALWANPEHRWKRSAEMKRTWQKPEYRQKVLAAQRKYHATPEATARKSAVLKRLWDNPERRKKAGAKMKKLWKDPQYRSKTLRARRRINTPLMISERTKGEAATSPKVLSHHQQGDC